MTTSKLGRLRRPLAGVGIQHPRHSTRLWRLAAALLTCIQGALVPQLQICEETKARHVHHKPLTARLPCFAAFGPQEFLQRWANALRRYGMKVQTYPHELGDLSRVEFAVCYDPPPGLLEQVSIAVVRRWASERRLRSGE